MISYFETAPLCPSQHPWSVKVTLSHRGVPTVDKTPGPGERAGPGPRSAPILIRARVAGRDRDGRDQTMSCIHGGLGQSQAGASRPRAAPPATARARGKPGLWAAICGHPGEGAPRSDDARPWRGGSGRRRSGPSGQGSRTEGRTQRPLCLERGAVPLRQASSRGREARRRPRRGGQRHPGYRAGDDDGPRAAPSPRGTPSWPRLGSAAEAVARGGPRRHATPQPGGAQPPPAPTSRTPGPGRRGWHAGHGRSARGPAPRAPASGPPRLLRVHRGGAPRRQPISASRPGTAPKVLAGGGAGGRTSLGARRGEAGGEKLGCPRGWAAGRGADRPRLWSSAEVKGAGAAGRGAGRAWEPARAGRREEWGGAGSRWCGWRGAGRRGRRGRAGRGEQASPGDRKTRDGQAELMSVKPESVKVNLCSTENLKKFYAYW